MKGFASTLSDEDMKNIAYWVTTKASKPGFAKEKDLVTLGERIYRGGIADRQVPACAVAIAPMVLVFLPSTRAWRGQHADYAVAQSTAFRDGVRKNSAQMTGVAAKIDDREIKAVSDYIAGLR